MPLRAWLPLVLSEEVNSAAHHARLTAFPILYVCFRDLVEAGEKHIVPIANEALRNGDHIFSHNVEQLALLCQQAIPILQTLSLEEQIFLSILRDRLAHGFLNGRANSSRKIKVCIGGKIIAKQNNQVELAELSRKFMPNNDLGDLEPLIDKTVPIIVTYASKIADLDVRTEVLTNVLMSNQIMVFDWDTPVGRGSPRHPPKP